MAMTGRLWTVNPQGYLVNDASESLIQPVYRAVIDEAITAYKQYIGNDIHSIYITGSIPRDLAIAGKSDLNIVAVLEYYTDPELVMQSWLETTQIAIADAHDCISDIQMDIWPHGWLLHDLTEFSISAFILKTQSVCVWGVDMTPDMTTYRFADRDTRIAIANDDIVQIEPDIEQALDEIRLDDSDENVSYWCRQTCKRIIHTMFGLVMVDAGIYTRDIDVSLTYILQQYPDYESVLHQTVDWIQSPTHSSYDLYDYLTTFGQWLIVESNKWLDTYNPERFLEFQFEYDDEL